MRASSQGQVVETLYYMSEHLQEWKNRRFPAIVIQMAKEKQMQGEPHTQGKEQHRSVSNQERLLK